MKIAIAAWGTTGDVYPLLALSERLLRRNHHIRICAPTLYKDKIIDIGADYYEVGVAFDLVEFHHTMDTMISMRDPMATLLIVAKEGILRRGEKWHYDCLEAMKGYDLVICHSVDIPAQEAAIKNGIPWLTVTYCPGFIKTPDNPPYPFPNWNRTFNSIIWKLVRLRLKYSVDPLFNQFIVSVGGKPRAFMASDEIYSPYMNLIAASPSICPPANLTPNHEYTGVWHFAQPDYTPPSELTEFLADGTPPIVITFGSMGGSDGKETTEILVEAIKMTDQRAIIQAGWGLLGTQEVIPNIYCTEYVPHRWLFPQARCVVHHGGAGTTASVCRAKVPSVVVPHIGDQFYWGKLLYDLGVAPKSLPRRKLTPERLAQRINRVMSTPAMTERAKTIGIQIASEDGLATAVDLIESFPLSQQ
ncbi:glycosyltransferase family 1 protein [Candidatus Poribacteria bacterium]|nr:glycosyltransferase family 1 protein [Candidatus Poribacteria bacterium]